MIGGLAAFSTPALAGLFAARVAPSGLTLQMSGAPAQNAGDLPPSGWGSETLAHSRNPTPTQLDPNSKDPLSKMTHIPQGESFAEYMARKNGGAPAAAAAAPPAAAPQQYSAPPPAYAPPAPAYQPAPAASYSPPAGSPAQNAGDLPPSGWGSETLAHSRNPTPTSLDPNSKDPLSKMTHIPQGESFTEYMARRAKEGGN